MWQTPSELPDLRRASRIAIDTETKDDRLHADMGSGWPTRSGYLCGISISWQAEAGIQAVYCPLRHPDSGTIEPELIQRWLRDHIAAGVRFVTQNGLYDWGWIYAEFGICMPPAEQLEEIGALATLIDENRYQYGLESLCQWRGLPGKDDTLLRDGIAALDLHKNKKRKLVPQEYLWQLPAHYVGPYAEAHAANTLALFENLNPILDQEGTRAAYELERSLLPMVQAMRSRGIRVDLEAAERAHDLLLGKRDAVITELSEKLGENVSMHEVGRSAWLAATFDRLNLKYPRTAKGNPSFKGGSSGWMTRHAHWLPQLITKADKYNNAATKFLQRYILDYSVNGRIHAEVHPHRSEGNGTKSFRFSYSDPPLQQMSAHDEEISPLIRGCFLPEEGEVWAKPDAKQQEFRFVLHYASQHHLPKAAEWVQRYIADPDSDFHALTAATTGLDRQRAKNTNFAKIYGAGPRRFAEMINQSFAEATKIYNQYDANMPFLRRLSSIYQGQARTRGYIVLYDDARRHFNKFAPGGTWKKGLGPCELEEARERIKDPGHPWHGKQLWRVDTYTALNALIQGSAARHTKLWMRAVWREGIVPLLQMHDSLDCSVSSPAQATIVQRLCCEVINLAVPMRCDLKYGRNWADATHTWDEVVNGAATAAVIVVPSPPIASEPPDTCAIVGAILSEIPGDALASPEAGRIPATDTSSPPVSRIPWAGGDPSIVIGTGFDDQTPRLPDVIGAKGKILCPFHDDHSPSLHVYDDHYHCFVCGAHGDAIDWLRQVEGLSYNVAAEMLANWAGPLTPARGSSNADVENTRTLALAVQLWEQAQPIADTPALQYLAHVRKIDTDALPNNVENVLRFHPRCPFGTGNVVPCLIALFRDVETDAPAGIHRIAIPPEVFAGAKVQRMTLGRWPTARAIKLWPAQTRLFLGEGIETTLAAATRLTYRDAPMRPAWAAGSATNISKFPVLPGVEALMLLVDYDPAGESAAAVCHTRWRSAGRASTRLKPEQAGTDFNDLVISKLQEPS